MRFSSKTLAGCIIVVLVAVFVVGFIAGTYAKPLSLKLQARELRQQFAKATQLTNPLLECAELPESLSIGERARLQNEVEKILEKYKAEGALAAGAVYFRDLNNGPWFGVNEWEKFSPASLLKVPLAISFVKRSHKDPNIMAQKIEYEKGSDNYEADQPFSPNHPLEDKKVYSVEDLLRLMLQESSNEAALLLAQIAGSEQIESVYKDFGMEVPTPGKDLAVDVRTYASFFRILYNATYLDREASETILTMLSQSTFRDGIVAGVPENTVVANKFGTRNIAGRDGVKQLHDCGIIYVPDNPYILCIMTQGKDFEELANFIKDVSKLVYENVAK